MLDLAVRSVDADDLDALSAALEEATARLWLRESPLGVDLGDGAPDDAARRWMTDRRGLLQAARAVCSDAVPVGGVRLFAGGVLSRRERFEAWPLAGAVLLRAASRERALAMASALRAHADVGWALVAPREVTPTDAQVARLRAAAAALAAPPRGVTDDALPAVLATLARLDPGATEPPLALAAGEVLVVPRFDGWGREERFDKAITQAVGDPPGRWNASREAR